MFSQSKYIFVLLSLLLLSCAPFDRGEEGAGETPEGVMEEVGSDTDANLVTQNVVYSGILEEGGVTLYQQGTHRLMLSDGKIVLLEPDEESGIALTLYVGKLVRLQGDVMPTFEAGGTLMKIKDIKWIRREVGQDGEEKEMLYTFCGGGENSLCPFGGVCRLEGDMGLCVGEEGMSEENDNDDKEDVEDEDNEEDEDDKDDKGEESEDDEEEGDAVDEEDAEDSDEDDKGEEDKMLGEEDEEESDNDDEKSGTEEEELPNGEEGMVDDSELPSAEGSAVITLMVEEDYDPARWTQEYCSRHVGFCIPVHRNWYFKSFGATASVLWHVEMGGVPVENFGDGPIVTELKTGSLASLRVTDGAVKKVGSRIIGYREWTEGRHIEISAVSDLAEAVIYLTGELKEVE